MSYTLGQQVVLTTAVTDVLGTPTNAAMSLTVTRPDGTTLVSGVGLTISNTGTGTYSCNVQASQAGTWLYVWTASGAAIGVDDGQFDVLAITRRIASLSDAKLHLNKQNTADDVEIQDFMDAAQAVITREVGDVVPTSYTETLNIDGYRLVLTQRPVISVTSVQVYYSASAKVTLDPATYRLDNAAAGIVERTGAGGYPIPFTGQGDTADVTYVAGRTGAVPANIRLAYLELTAHLWRNSQQGRNRRVRGPGPEDDMATVGLGFSLPNRVRELLGPKQPVVF
jgi:uncharacterized phiE125 gp8 family phage protein